MTTLSDDIDTMCFGIINCIANFGVLYGRERARISRMRVVPTQVLWTTSAIMRPSPTCLYFLQRREANTQALLGWPQTYPSHRQLLDELCVCFPRHDAKLSCRLPDSLGDPLTQ
jgi:hypothetical protein